MSRIVYVNGRYRPYAEAAVHVEDRGFQFADAIYEVVEVRDRRLVDSRRHLDRLERSLSEIKMTPPMSRPALLNVIRQTIQRNGVQHGLVYIQVSRGAGPRDFAFPAEDIQPTVVVIARSQNPAKIAATADAGIAVRTMLDMRWGRSDIKTVMLLPACLAKNEGKAHGAKEVWLVDANGNVTEGASSNAWIVTADDRLVTRHLDTRILPGVTRATVIDAAAAAKLKIDERAFSVREAYEAKEAFITSATNTVMPVVQIDEHVIGDGKPGPLTRQLRSAFHHIAETSAY